jgi:hypothetical protein
MTHLFSSRNVKCIPGAWHRREERAARLLQRLARTGPGSDCAREVLERRRGAAARRIER